ncbi:hypothetical protein GALMADRAFT_265308 [Galerina marginata CBS 339.88]|uniref:Uncharacterized protein n=1 Tax=Galerina marginata (strain CBS 339.88) TaxID=685588 RepID=A0A067TA92_GALM3|nr:hypothetical protein GALMADRAFT_265308 [Galerina marginata CBS 339.88]
MSLDARPMRLALYALRLLGLLSLALPVIATPIPLPLPLMAADYSLSPVSVNRSIPKVAARRLQSLPIIASVYSTESSRSLGGLGGLDELEGLGALGDFGSLGGLRSVEGPGSLADLARYSDGASQNAKALKKLAATSEGVDSDDYDFQQDYVSSLSDFNTNVQGYEEAYAQAKSDKGLANYDKQNDLETLAKQIVDAHKVMLDSTARAVDNIPGLGPALAPIVYETKCIIIAILDLTEDLTDALTNFLGPALQALLGTPPPDKCKNGAVILGLCL